MSVKVAYGSHQLSPMYHLISAKIRLQSECRAVNSGRQPADGATPHTESKLHFSQWPYFKPRILRQDELCEMKERRDCICGQRGAGRLRASRTDGPAAHLLLRIDELIIAMHEKAAEGQGPRRFGRADAARRMITACICILQRFH